MQNPFSVANVHRAQKVVKNVEIMVKAVRAIKAVYSRERDPQLRLSSKMPSYKRNKRLINLQIAKNTPKSMNNSTDSCQAVSKEVLMKGPDFSTQYIAANNSPLADSFMKVICYYLDINRLHVINKDSTSMQHQAHTNQIHSHQLKACSADRQRYDRHIATS